MAAEWLSFTVRRREAVLVAPAEPTPHEFKELADVDFQGTTRLQISGIWFYRGNMGMDVGADPARVIKEALSKALVFYYPFAGRIRGGVDGRRPVVECTGEGVLLAEADADIRLDQFGDALLPPIPCSEQLLQNVDGSEGLYDTPLLLIQVTRLRCGGFAMGVRLNHILSDAAGLLQLLKATAELARGAPRPTLLPVWQRYLLQARDPPQVSYAHREYDEEEPVKFEDSVLRSFFLRREDVRALKSRLPGDMQKITSFDLLTACVWRCRIAALRLDPGQRVRAMAIVTGRGRCSAVVPPGYYGNSFAHPVALSTAGELCGNPLAYAVQLISKAKSEMTTEYLRSTADLIAVKGSATYTSSIGSMIVSDLRQLGLRELDFGWGDAVAHFYFHYTNTKGEEGVVVMLRLPAPAMERFAEEMETMMKDC
ncbi:unnamed protein product [Spirodela intermedia]|uniref:Uncharacterized protein n=1 Tax=Spirodela intermedia TaxID=51605 RepID=A0A7I8IN67_SPIIN|nr:unnamed protein product [Spirodela intermedia]CAA6659239.1 unnamed protein product [Spirodela intermedia]CAA6675837.1 unnamed protein product [Spirodela intermedia]